MKILVIICLSLILILGLACIYIYAKRGGVFKKSTSTNTNTNTNSNNIPLNSLSYTMDPILLNTNSRQWINNKFTTKDNLDYNKIVYKGKDTIQFIEACTIQANSNLIARMCMYYEVEIVNIESSELLIGYGKQDNSILFNCITNQILINKVEYNRAYTHDLKQGDIIGCFYDSVNREVTFTHNGNDINYTEYDTRNYDLFPTVYCGKGNVIKANLGDYNFCYQRANSLMLNLSNDYVKEVPPTYSSVN